MSDDTPTFVRRRLPLVEPPAELIRIPLQHKIDTKTKPPGSLGLLEPLALKLGMIQQTLEPTCEQPTIIVFAGDHGLVNAGVSPYPQEVTAQMVANFLAGGAAINVFAGLHDVALQIVDAGVANPIPGDVRPIEAKVGPGTANMLESCALLEHQVDQCLGTGANLVNDLAEAGTNVVGFGEMGIGNTSAAAAITHLMTGIALDDCVGRGTGLDDAGLAAKRDVLGQVITRARSVLPDDTTQAPHGVLREVGGFEIAMMTGAMLQAAERKMCILVDGFIATAALLVARRIAPDIMHYCVFSHQSDEQGHTRVLQHLGEKPLLNLNMRLGEGTGAALAVPLVRAAITFLNDMASFESAGVSDRNES